MLTIVMLLSSILVSSQAISTESAASDAQIKFAIENKYDDTGPGSSEPSVAYQTSKDLEGVLLTYLNDKDTKLPEDIRELMYEKLTKSHKKQMQDLQMKYLPVQTGHYNPETVYKFNTHHKQKVQEQPLVVTRYSFPDKKVIYHEPVSKLGILDLTGIEGDFTTKFLTEKLKSTAPNRLKKVQQVKTSPLNLRYYTKEEVQQEEIGPFDPNPQYSFSYGVHDKTTGDSKSAHETRDGGRVRGYYTFLDADGKQRSVHYTADDKEGFKAVVQRISTNGQ